MEAPWFRFNILMMNTLEIKGSILELLADIQDADLLLKIKNLLVQLKSGSTLKSIEPDWITDDQIADLKNGLEEIKDKHNVILHDEVMKKPVFLIQ